MPGRFVSASAGAGIHHLAFASQEIVRTLRAMFNHDGSAIRASLTPAMREREADENGPRYIYRLIDIEKLGLGVEALPELLIAAERMGFAGVNVTLQAVSDSAASRTLRRRSRARGGEYRRSVERAADRP